MDGSDLDDLTPLIPNYGIPTAIRDTRQRREKRLAVIIILASTLFERIAFYTLAANLALSLESDKQPYWKSPKPSVTTFIFIGVSNLSTLIFAVISDAKLGRSKTILIGFVLYIIGYVLATLVTISDIEKCADWILVSIIIIAIGAGAVESNMAVFGAEQIQESKLTSRYFEKYVIIVNIGGIIAMFAVPSLQTQDRYYYIAYLVAAVVLVIAALLFFMGRKYYIHVVPYDTVITTCIPVVISAFQSWYKYNKNKISTHTELMGRASNVSNIPYIFLEPDSTKDERPLTFLDFAKAAHNGKFHDRIVDDVKSLRGALVVFILLIPYWLIYHQLHSTFREQAQAMHGSNINELIIVSLADPITIIIGISIFIFFIYKYMDTRKWVSTVMAKFTIGMFFAVLTMSIAGTIEIFRQYLWDKDEQESDLNVYAQLPQNICMGLSEIFLMVASFEYAYFGAPRSAQTLFMSLRFCSVGISSFIGAAYILVFPKPSFDLNFSSKQNESWPFFTYFFILAGLQLIFLIIFVICQQKFRLIKINPQQMERNIFRESSTLSIDRQ